MNTIGYYGEHIINNNEKRLLEFCVDNNLVIMSTFFQHTDILKCTREVPQGTQKSIIDL